MTRKSDVKIQGQLASDGSYVECQCQNTCSGMYNFDDTSFNRSVDNLSLRENNTRRSFNNTASLRFACLRISLIISNLSK